jgi:hypothetical protein
LEDTGVAERIILKLIFKIGMVVGVMDWNDDSG